MTDNTKADNTKDSNFNLTADQIKELQDMIAEVETTKITFFESAGKQIAFYDGIIAGYKKLLPKTMDNEAT